MDIYSAFSAIFKGTLQSTLNKIKTDKTLGDYIYANLKRCVLSLFLKTFILSLCFMVQGRGFHSLGAALENALSPYVTWFDFGTVRRSLSSDLKPLFCFHTSRSCRYTGACSCKHINVIKSILNTIRHSTGSQWSCLRTGVIWSYLYVLVTSLAAMFCTHCSLRISFFGNPYRSELQ